MTGGATAARMIVSRLARKVGWTGRKRVKSEYLCPELSLREFFEDLNRTKARYVVLRWFERLPEIQPGEDLDLLVCDDSLATVLGHLRPGSSQVYASTSIKCDLKSVSGSYGSWLKQIAYYPPFFAEQILDRAVLHQSGAMVPCEEDHFFSLAYHALYHKGLAAGLPLQSGAFTPEPSPEHDYKGVLTDLASRIECNAPIEMDALDKELSNRGLCPPMDIKPDLLPADAWLRRRMGHLYNGLPVIAGLTVFVLRERAMGGACAADLVERLQAAGFHILATTMVSEEARIRASWFLRGSDWGGAKWPVAGGAPAFAIAAVDLCPTPPDAELLRKHPELDNAHAFRFKLDFRQAWNAVRAPEEHSNVIHSADNARQAIIYVRTLMPELEQEFTYKARDLPAEMQIAAPI
jgi:hypothetical protein